MRHRVWSTRSITSANVKDEASYALDLEKLVPVALDEAKPPFRFRRLHAIQLQGWDGSTLFPAFQELIKALEAKAGRPNTRKEKILDLLKPPKPPTISVHEIGADARDLMELHYELMKDAAPVIYHVSLDSLAFPEPAYGRITRLELSRFIERPNYHIDAKKQKEINRREELARKVLRAMDSKTAKVVDYMPAQLKNLPAHLTKRAVEILLEDPSAGRLGRPLEVSPDALRTHRSLQGSPEVKHLVDQIAQHLGWRKE